MAFRLGNYIYYTAGDWLRFWRKPKNREAMRKQIAENLSAPNPVYEYLKERAKREPGQDEDIPF